MDEPEIQSATSDEIIRSAGEEFAVVPPTHPTPRWTDDELLELFEISPQIVVDLVGEEAMKRIAQLWRSYYPMSTCPADL